MATYAKRRYYHLMEVVAQAELDAAEFLAAGA